MCAFAHPYYPPTAPPPPPPPVRRYRQGCLVEVNAHSLFSKFFSESGKLVRVHMCMCACACVYICGCVRQWTCACQHVCRPALPLVLPTTHIRPRTLITR